MAASKQCSMAQLALAWLLAKDSVSTVLLGATKQHQLADNLGAAEMVLSEGELAQLDAATGFPPHYPSSNWVESMLPGRKKQ
jgi:aryl-alcohol dehydrogenase-like predicted oxidoreductase